ncbi:D-aminopeptidase [Colletotrichum sp. SAR 10_66]|nr:D-aminopeptidase [Colletotrichum sp. SAR 10_66]
MPVSEEVTKQLLDGIPSRVRGPGGAIAVLKDGKLIGQRVWGYADLVRKIPMTAETLLPICSISKQMLCALMYDLEHNPPASLADKGDVKAKFSDKMTALLHPNLTRDGALTIDHLANNQSGIRDYWALSVLWGAQPEDRFSIADHSKLMIERLQSFHFEPGMEYSYANTNFHILGRIVEQVTGDSIASLLEQRIFGPAKMKTARLAADTAQLPPPCVGYEGDEQRGFFPADNKIEWAGDAGVVASLSDMIAYEQYLDRISTERGSWYEAALKQPLYKDGTPAGYAQGLGHGKIENVKVVGHSGALRGFRLYRVHAPEERISVVVLLNHEGGSAAPAEEIIRGLLDLKKSEPAPVDADSSWFGTFLDEQTQLAITVSQGTKGKVNISYAGSAEAINLKDPKHAESPGMVAKIDGNQLKIHRVKENRALKASRILQGGTVNYSAFGGDFYCAEIDSTFHCRNEGRMLFGSFNGYLGHGPAHLMRYIGQDLEELLVCCSSACRSEEHGIRLPLLRLIPTPNPFYVLCQKATQMGYRPDANCLGRLVLSQRPDQCPDNRAAPDAKTNNILSWTASRDIMTRSNFPTHIHCAACLGIGHGGVVNIQPAYMQPIGQTSAMPLHITMNVTGVRNRWIRG